MREFVRASDEALAPCMFRLSALGQDRFWSQAKRPRLNDWYRRLSARPAFQAAASWPDENGGGYGGRLETADVRRRGRHDGRPLAKIPLPGLPPKNGAAVPLRRANTC